MPRCAATHYWGLSQRPGAFESSPDSPTRAAERAGSGRGESGAGSRAALPRRGAQAPTPPRMRVLLRTWSLKQIGDAFTEARFVYQRPTIARRVSGRRPAGWSPMDGDGRHPVAASGAAVSLRGGPARGPRA